MIIVLNEVLKVIKCVYFAFIFAELSALLMSNISNHSLYISCSANHMIEKLSIDNCDVLS